ncbi:hypothetical protein PROFUN_16636, partial [Planoprotostelium fungivorum]
NNGQRPSYFKTRRAQDGAEPILFKEKFWNFKDDLPIMSRSPSPGNISRRILVEFSAKDMYMDKRPAEDPMVDDGRGKIQMWYIDGDSKRKVYPSDMHGHFFTGDSYIILYTYRSNTSFYAGSSASLGMKDKHLIYFWQGSRSSVKKKGWSALLTTEMSREIEGDAPTQCRIPQQKETRHFMSIYNEATVIHRGTYESRRSARDSQERLYQLRCNYQGLLRAVEVDNKSESFNTNDAFFLSGQNPMLWLGRNSEFEKDKGQRCVKWAKDLRMCTEGTITTVEEGNEPESFWKILGGKKSYYNEPYKSIRFFHTHMATGTLTADRIWDYSQFDLVERDVIIVDTQDMVVLWKGSKADETKEQKGMKIATEYVDGAPSGKRKAPILLIHSRHEPQEFRRLFQDWDNSKSVEAVSLDSLQKVSHIMERNNRKYSVVELRTKPEGLDQHNLEKYLTEEDFESTFEMDRASFEAMPGWKREERKKKLGLF